MNKQTEDDRSSMLLALDILCPIAIMSYISFCETMLNVTKSPFKPINFRAIDVMLKMVSVIDISYLCSLKLDVYSVKSMYETAKMTYETEESGFAKQLEESGGYQYDDIMRDMIIHLTNHQDVQIPDYRVSYNWMRLDYLLNVIEPKYASEIKRRFSCAINVKTLLSDLVGLNGKNIYLAINDIINNLLDMYKDSSIHISLNGSVTDFDREATTIQILDEILKKRLYSASFLYDVSRLFTETENHHVVDKLMFLISQSIHDLRYNYAVFFEKAQKEIPEIKPTSYRYESPLLKHPLVNVENETIIPNLYDLFACLTEFPLRFNEYLDVGQNKITMSTLGHIYEFYVGELLTFTLDPERFIAIPEFEYLRNRSKVQGPDFVIIDRISQQMIVIEVKSARTKNVVRDNPASLMTQVYLENVCKVLKQTLVKIEEIFSFVGKYDKHRNLISQCKKENTYILRVQKDIGVLIPSLIHGELTKQDPILSEQCCLYKYCLLDIPNLEIILHNHKATGKSVYDYLDSYHQIQIGKPRESNSISEWVPIEHSIRDTVFYQSY